MFEGPPFDRFSRDALRALVCSRQEAEDVDADHVGTEHMLLGLLRVGEGSAFRALIALGIDEMRLRRDIDQLPKPPALDADVRKTPAFHAFEFALQESIRRGDKSVRSAHVLAGIVHFDSGRGAAVLKRQWIEPAAVMAAIDRELRVKT